MKDIRTIVETSVKLKKLMSKPPGYREQPSSVKLTHVLTFARGKTRTDEETIKKDPNENNESFHARVEAKINERHDEFINKHKSKKNFADGHKNHIDTKTAMMSSSKEPQLHTRSFGAGEEGKFKEKFETFISAKSSGVNANR